MKIARHILAACCFALLGAVTQAQSPAAPFALNIPEQPMQDALNALAKQTGLQVVFAVPTVEGKTAPKIEGSYSPQTALKLLLAGTQLSYEFVDDKTIAIRPAAAVPTAHDPDVEVMRLVQNGAPTEKTESQSQTDSSQSAASKKMDSPSAEGGADKLEEIVVTAQRREQNLQDVPISISVLSGEALDQSTGDGVLDALERVAGVAVTPSGGNTGSVISIRGVAPVVSSFFSASPIGYYLDSAPFGFIKAAFVPDMGAYDLERVEVLRGPQGTLYGASSVGGLVRVLSKDADLDSIEFKARSSLSQTRYGGLNFGGDAAVNVPIIEGALAARLVVGYQDLSGWIDQPNTGRKDANDELNKTLRFKINAQPTDALSLELSAWFSRNKDSAPARGSDSREYLTGIDETQHSDFDLYAFELGYDFGAVSFNSATNFMSYGMDAISDQGTTGAVNLTNRQSVDVFSQEARLVSTTEGPWRWTAGAIYRHVEERIVQSLVDSTGALTGGFVQPTDITLFSKSYAAFGELTRAFLDGRFELTGGLRYFHDKVHQRENSQLSGVPVTGDGRSRTFEKVSPRLVASWLPSKHFTAYASYSEGFRSGVDQYASVSRAEPTLPDSQPDNLRNYEIGFKGDLLDGGLSFELAAFFMDWQNIQSADLAYIVPPGSFAAVTLNGKSASGPGIDLSLVARPTDHLSFGANVGWNDLTYDDDVIASFGPFGSAVVFYKGDRLSLSPEVTGSVWVDYRVPLSGDGHDLRFGASANYLSERYQRLFGIQTELENGPQTFVAARVTLETPNNWSLTLFADNLTNEQEPYGGFDPGGRVDQTSIPRPRTVGIQLSYRY